MNTPSVWDALWGVLYSFRILFFLAVVVPGVSWVIYTVRDELRRKKIRTEQALRRPPTELE